jgi:tRNA dimethylallyltransferase
MQHPPAILLVGPTASGKTALAFELAAHFPCDIVSVDSAQVFRDMDIGTAKPDARDTCALSAPPDRPDLAGGALFRRALSRRRAARDARSSPRQASRCWPAAPCSTSRRCAKDWPTCRRPTPHCAPRSMPKPPRAAGRRCMPNWRRLDPETAARLKPGDAQRIQRALEVVRLTGRRWPSFFAEQARPPRRPSAS